MKQLLNPSTWIGRYLDYEFSATQELIWSIWVLAATAGVQFILHASSEQIYDWNAWLVSAIAAAARPMLFLPRPILEPVLKYIGSNLPN